MVTLELLLDRFHHRFARAIFADPVLALKKL
jgi:hypothetical protein